jgi:integrase
MKVSDAVDAYIEYRTREGRAQLATRTTEGYEGVAEGVIRHPPANLGRKQLQKVSPPVVNKWLADLRKAGVPESTIKRTRVLLSGTLRWAIGHGHYIGTNPLSEVTEFWSKSARDADEETRPVLLPTWKEFATLVQTPKRADDALLLALLGWCGLRWSEAVSLRVDDVWKDRPVITVARVLVWKQEKHTGRRVKKTKQPTPETPRGQWVEEPVKGGHRANVPVPTPLWKALRTLADQRAGEPTCPEPAGNLLFRAEKWTPASGGWGVLDNSNFKRDTFYPAREACGLTGDPSRPELDPRRNPLLIKDLRAFAASVLMDAGATVLEASKLLRHADSRTTLAHYARAQEEESFDEDRVSVRDQANLNLSERLEKLYSIWAKKFPQAAKKVQAAGQVEPVKVSRKPKPAIEKQARIVLKNGAKTELVVDAVRKNADFPHGNWSRLQGSA